MSSSLLHSSSNFSSYPPAPDVVDFRKGLDFVLDPHLSSHRHQQHDTTTGFSPPAPSSPHQDYRHVPSSSPEENESFLPPNYMLSPDSQEFDLIPRAAKQEMNESQRNNGAEIVFPRNTIATSSMDLDNPVQPKMSSLVRHSSSPADFFSTFGLDNGLHFNGHPNTVNEAPHVMNFSSGPTLGSRRPMPCIAETGNEGIGGLNRHFTTTALATESWENASLTGHKRPRESQENLFHAIQVGDSRDRPQALSHHLSLPANFGQMAATENILHFEGHVPCKIRAKRGFATHPRSIAERARRSRISQKMRKLQDLFPDLDKQTSTADMLDMAVDYIKKLEEQVKGLTENVAKCSCPRQQK